MGKALLSCNLTTIMDFLPKHLIYKAEFDIRAGEIGYDKKITVPSLMQLLQEASLKHIFILKASVWDLIDSAWVLLGKEINIKRFPELSEKVTVETYPSGVDRIFAYRDYRMFDNKGNCIVEASSTWTLMNTVKRSLERIPDHIMSLPLPQGITLLPRCNRKIIFPNAESEMAETFKVNFYHLDWNAHVNNVNYLRFILESDPGRLKTSKPKKIEIHFKTEAMEGDILSVYNIQGTDDNETFHSISKAGSSKVIAQAKIFWD